MRALFVGLGSVGQRHLRNLRAIAGDSVDVVAFRARGLSRRLDERGAHDDDVERALGVRAYATLEEALATGPDVAFICNPSSMHVTSALAAARAGCHLFIEKPVAASLDGLDELAREVAARHLVTFVGYQLRFHPLLQRLAELLAEDAIGAPLAVRACNGEHLPDWHPYEDYRTSYAARAELGGGATLTMIHELDYLLWLFGAPRRLWAVGGHLSELEVDVDDVASVLMECRSRSGGPLPVHVQLDYVQRPPQRTCDVVGTAGRAALDLARSTLSVRDARGVVREEHALSDFARNDLFVAELSHFLACVRGEETSRVPLACGIDSLRIALAARESMSSGLVREL